MKRALITGITGQDGSYLTELLLGLGYEVHGLMRQTGLEQIKGSQQYGAQPGLYERCCLHPISLDNLPGLYRLASQTQFEECYHLAAASFVGESLADGYHTPFMPRSAYGISKLAAYHLVRNYREAQGMFACTGFLYNHESPRRRPEFVTRKITLAVARIAAGLQDKLELGSLDARRDWGYAPDYVRAMHAMLQADHADDYVVATGVLRSVGELCEVAFHRAGLDWRQHVVCNPLFVRPDEAVPLQGDPSKIESELGWRREQSFETMIAEMVDADRERVGRGGMM